jgi:DNA adenine methylase
LLNHLLSGQIKKLKYIEGTSYIRTLIDLVPPQTKMKPPLKWAGGKRWLLKSIEGLWEPYKKLNYRFVEPFCGGLAVTLGLMPKKASLNDVNHHLINFYAHLARGITNNMKMKYDEEMFYEYRKRFNDLVTGHNSKSREAALLFYYLNHTCYNGLCRFNQKGLFNVPFGEYKDVTYVRNFEIYHQAFQNWEFSCKDFEKVTIQKHDFVYADPPYDVEFRQYSSGGFDWEDQIRLAKWIKSLKVPAIISNQATDRIIELYRAMNFDLTFLDGPRMISCKGNRDRAKEVLAIKVP